MFRSIRWRLVASYTLLTLLSVSLVGILALSLVKHYVAQQEERHLLANAEAIARQAEQFMLLGDRQPEDAMLAELAYTSAFLGNARVRIFDPQQQLLADSGAIAEAFIWLTPSRHTQEGLSDEHLSALLLGSSSLSKEEVLPFWFPIVEEEIDQELRSLTSGQIVTERTVVKVSRGNGIWGSQVHLEFESTIDHRAPEESNQEAKTPIPPIHSPSDAPNRPVEGANTDAKGRDASGTSRLVSVPIGSVSDPLGYVELSNSPDLSIEALTTTRQAFGVAAIGATLLAVLVGLVVSRHLTAPLHQLTIATNRMSEGQLSTRAEVDSNDEIGHLATQFNQMATQLEQSFSELAAERDALRRFIADASHELRTPITALKTFNELLQTVATDDPAAQTEFLAESETQIQRLEWITQNLLDLSRFDAGLVSLDLETHDLGDMFNGVLALFCHRATEQEIALEQQLPINELTITCDRPRLELALSNLIDNALKFTPSGGQIILSAQQQPTQLILSLQDTGPGIPLSEQPHIFKRFYRAHTNNVPGSGLGLAITHSIIQAHGGQIGVVSEEGKGAHFEIRLPV